MRIRRRRRGLPKFLVVRNRSENSGPIPAQPEHSGPFRKNSETLTETFEVTSDLVRTEPGLFRTIRSGIFRTNPDKFRTN